MQTFFQTFIKTSSSMKTGLVLLALLGVLSALGSSLLPDTFYRIPLFEVLIVLLFTNLGLCTINRIVKTRKMLFSKTKDVMMLVRQWGLLVLHTGLILILVGGIINASAGQSGNIAISEGEKAAIAHNDNGEHISLLLRNFEIELYENDMPSQFYSKVILYEGETQKLKTVISVNHPLEYDGIKVYQQSYGSLVAATVECEGNAEQHMAHEGDMLQIPGSDWGVKVFKYVPDFDPAHGMESKSLEPNNPKVIYSVYQDNELLGVGAAAFGEIVTLDDTASVIFNGIKPYSVLQVKEDPGLPYAAAGAILFMLGVALAEVNIFRKQ